MDANVFLSHRDWSPLVYGVVMFFGLLIMYWKLVHGKLFSLLIDTSIFYLVFSLHGGSMAGGFSAMVAALLAGLIFPIVGSHKSTE